MESQKEKKVIQERTRSKCQDFLPKIAQCKRYKELEKEKPAA